MDRNNIFTVMKYVLYSIIVTSLFLTGCISPEKEDFDGGVWRADDGATVYLNGDGSVIINQINRLNVVSGGIKEGDFVNFTGEWKFTTDFNNQKIIDISTDDRGGFDFHIKGQGIFENKRPFDLFVYIGDPDNMDRYIFKRISIE